MAWPHRVAAGLRALFRRDREDRDLDDELRAWLDESTDAHVRAGMTPGDAARAARVEMGSLAAVRDHTRDAGWEAAAEALWHDVRYTLRMLRRSPAFAAVSVLTLGLGIGATTAIFSLLDAVLLKALPVQRPGELVVVRGGGQYPTFHAFRQRTDVFQDLLATSGVTALDVEVQPGVREPADVSLVSGSYFSTLGVPAAIGRTFTMDEDRVPGAHPVAVLSDGYWRRRFGGDPAARGRVVHISGTPVTIIGIAPAGFFGEQVGDAPDLWLPLTMWGQVVPGRNFLQSPGTGWLGFIGRVRPDQTPIGPHAGLTRTFQAVLAEIFGPQADADLRREIAEATVVLEPAARGLSSLRSRFARPLQLLMGAVVLVLLIACANIANLLLARAAARRREIDLRAALGMGRGRLIRQLLTESLVLASFGGALGVAVAWAGREALLRLISGDGSRLTVAVETDVRLLGFVALVSSCTAVVFGLAPAWHAARASLAPSLGTRTDGGGRARYRPVLVIAQVALSLVLLMGAGLFLRTVANLREVDLGFMSDGLIVLDVNPASAGYEGERAIAMSRGLLERFAGLPGVSAVSLSENGVLMGRDSSTNQMRAEGAVAGPEGFPRTSFDVVGPDYFATLRTPLVAGRDFSSRDTVGAPPVIAINEGMARRFFGDASPIGRRMVWGAGGEASLEIVAVTRDVRQSGPRDEPQLRFYLPYLQLPAIRSNWSMASVRFLVRTSASVAAVVPAVRQAVTAVEPRLSMIGFEVASDLVGRALIQERIVAILLAAFGALATALACLGVYGLIAYQVVQRTGEIGIRMALGASRRRVLWSTLGRGASWIAIGLVMGVPLSVTASRLGQGLLFGLSPADVRVLASAAGLMAVLGLLAAYLPARRASRLDPLRALRHE